MSYCGGLPAPDANDNPLGYKFSWSPRGVLLAARNSAHYLKDGQAVTVAGQNLFKHHWSLAVEGLGEFEAYPNRDSVPYREMYGLANVGTMYRGTLRNKGWCDTLDNIARLGWLDETARDAIRHALMPISAATCCRTMRRTVGISRLTPLLY